MTTLPQFRPVALPERAVLPATILGVNRRFHDVAASISALNEVASGLQPPGSLSLWDPKYGVVGDGVRNDRAAIAAAIADLKALGGGTLDMGSGSFNIGNITGTDAGQFIFTRMSGIRIVGGMWTILCHTTTHDNPSIFRFEDCENIRMVGGHLIDRGYDPTVGFVGATLFLLTNQTQTSGQLSGFVFRDCGTDGAVAFVQVVGTVGARIRGIRFEGFCHVKNTLYGFNCSENGDDATGHIFCTDPRRAYFPYGVSGHDLTFWMTSSPGVGQADAMCLIKRYSRDTRMLKLRIVVSGVLANWHNLVCLEQEPIITGTGLIEDVSVDIHIDPTSSSLGTTVPLRVRSYTSDGVEETTTTNRWNRITLTGALAGATTPIVIGCTQQTEGCLTIGPEVGTGTPLSTPTYPGFVVRTGPDREFRTLAGDLTTQPLVIPLANLQSNAITLVCRVYAHADYSVLAGQNSVIREDVVCGYITGGVFTIATTTNVFTVAQGVAPTVTYAAAGSTLTVTFAGAGYANANAFARVETQYVSRGPWYS